jgi:predicted SAM-dependent methyltransferase
MKKLEIGCGDRPSPGFMHQDVINLIKGDGEKLDFECLPWEICEKDFDLIIAVGVMEHLRFVEFEKTIEHFLKILSVNGQFLFDVPNLKIWCQYYIDSCNGKKTPCEHFHILNTLYGWQRWNGDEHKSGWDESKLHEIIAAKNYCGTSFKIEISDSAEIFKALGIKRNRFERPWDGAVSKVNLWQFLCSKNRLFITTDRVKNQR